MQKKTAGRFSDLSFLARIGALLGVVVLPVSAGAIEPASPPVTTAISSVRGAAVGSGGKGLIAYTARHEVNTPVAAGSLLPGARIATADHPAEFRGAYGDAVFAGAWLAPRGFLQLDPSSQLYENIYFFNRLRGTTGPDRGVPMAPGDHVEVAMENVTNDAPTPWAAPRANPGGRLEWDSAQDSRNVTATYGAVSGEMDALFVRADVVARGGDVDGRARAVTTEPLVIDLPKTYGPTTTGEFIVATFFPVSQYVAAMRLRVDPQLGKAFLTAVVQGYIPEASEYTLPGGAEIKEWHLPLHIVIMLKPSDALSGAASLTLPAGGRAIYGRGEQLIKELAVPNGGTVVATTAREFSLLGETGTPEAGAATQSLSMSRQELSDASAINRLTAAPIDLTAGESYYGVTLNPDYRGEGVLALESVRRLTTGTPYMQLSAVPFVMLDGAPVKLSRDRLVDLRVYPYARWFGVQFNSSPEAMDPSRSRTLRGSLFQPGFTMQAVYDLGLERYAFLQTAQEMALGGRKSLPTRVTVLSLATGARVATTPVHYVEVPSSGPIVYNETTLTNEFSAPLDSSSPNPTLRLGDRSFEGSIFSSSTNSAGFVTALRAPGPLTAFPQPAPNVSLKGEPVALYYMHSPGATGSLTGFLVAAVTLDADGPAPVPQPKPIGQLCGPPQIEETSQPGDAPPALDIRAAWFDADAANLYASIKIAELPAAAPPGTTYSWAVHWLEQHVTKYARASLDSAGQFSFERGFYGAITPATYTRETDASGDFRIGPDGIVRIAVPRAMLEVDYRDGEFLRDTSARSLIYTSVGAMEIDQAPDGSSPLYGSGGDYVVGLGCLPVQLSALASRKNHGSAGVFDVALPLAGAPGIECRSGGANGDHVMIFTFGSPLSAVESAHVSSGSGMVTTSMIVSDPRQYIVNLTGATDAQVITVTLTGVSDSAGNNSPSVQGTMGVLLGDTSADGVVNAADITETRRRSGQLTAQSNFRTDLSIDGVINSADITTARRQSGTALPTP